MPKKDTASAIAGMLSVAGAQTRPPARTDEPAASRDLQSPGAVQAEGEAVVQASVSALPTTQRASTTTAGQEAPRTLRLRPETAQRLRAAWLEAKRDDVLLTAQDFASNLVEEALQRHRRTAQSS